MQKSFLKSVLYYYKVFKRYTGKKLYLLVALIITGGITEGIGITLFIPLLSKFSSESAGKDTLNIYFYKALNFLHLQPTFNSILLLITVVFILKAVIALMQEALSSHITASLTMDLRYQMLSAYTDMKYSYYLNSNIGYLNNIITKEVERAVSAFGDYCNSIVAVIYILIYTGVSISISWHASILALVSGALVVYSFKFLNHLSRRYSLLTSEKNAFLQEFLIQTIHFFKYLKATGSLNRIRAKLDKEIKLLADYVFRLGLIGGTIKSLKEPITILLMIGLLFFQVSLMGKTIAEIMVIVLVFYRLVTKIFILQLSWQKFNGNIGGIDTFVDAFEQISNNIDRGGTRQVKQFKDGITFKNVDFSFGDKQILSNINITISKNHTTAIIGDSGAGKSTLVDLIIGILRPTSGSMYFDNIDYKNLNIKSLHQMIGYVTQENVVFHDSIANNISLWRRDNNDPECETKIYKAAEIANCVEFIQNTEFEYDTIIGDRGIKLSGGQRQRLSIARELFKEPDILILDEATSSLDSESELYIQKSIDSLRGSKTIVIIAHRLSTIKNCDYIYVLQKGRVVEEGSYNSLYNGNTVFNKMCKAQKI